MRVQERWRKGVEVKLGEALDGAKKAREYHDRHCSSYQGCCDYDLKADDLIDAIEAYLEAERKSAEMLLGLADLQRHGGD